MTKSNLYRILLWLIIPEGMGPTMAREPCHQWVVRAGIWLTIFHHTGSQKSKSEVEYMLKASYSSIPLTRLQKFLKLLYQLETKCLNSWAYWGHLNHHLVLVHACTHAWCVCVLRHLWFCIVKIFKIPSCSFQNT